MTSTSTSTELSEVTSSTPDVVVRKIMCALKRGDIEEATNHFSDRFTFGPRTCFHVHRQRRAERLSFESGSGTPRKHFRS